MPANNHLSPPIEDQGPGRNYRGVFPGVFTMGNVVCGFMSILSAFEGNIATACWMIVLAAFLDALDGKIARLSGGASQFGVELDSLADIISFGVAPATLIYQIQLSPLAKFNWIVPVIFLMAAAYRLARFNLCAETEEKRDFVGLPVPMAALACVTYLLFCHAVWEELRYSQAAVMGTLVLSFLMVSRIQYDAIPEEIRSPENRVKMLILIGAGAILLIHPSLLLFPICASYILFGIIREVYRLFAKGVVRMAGRNAGSGSDSEGSIDE